MYSWKVSRASQSTIWKETLRAYGLCNMSKCWSGASTSWYELIVRQISVSVNVFILYVWSKPVYVSFIVWNIVQICVIMLSTSPVEHQSVECLLKPTLVVWLTVAVRESGKSLPSSQTSSIIPILGSSLMTELLSEWKTKQVETN